VNVTDVHLPEEYDTGADSTPAPSTGSATLA
jgi:hypothetical protein